MSAGRILTLGLGTPFSAKGYLPTLGLGTGAVPPAPATRYDGIRLRKQAKLRAQAEQEDAELIRIVRTEIAPKLLTRKRGPTVH